MCQRLILGVLASAAAFGLSPAPALAGTFSISPLRVELSSRVQTGALKISNQEETPVVVQAEAVLWEQTDGSDRLTPTRDVLVRMLPEEGTDNNVLGRKVLTAIQSENPGVELRRTEVVGGQVGAELAEKGALAVLFTFFFIHLTKQVGMPPEPVLFRVQGE